MNGYAIIKLEADAIAAKDDILPQFNAYMQQSEKNPSFVGPSSGYFRISYNGPSGISSAAIEKFGTFLQSSGYSISGISAATGGEGNGGTLVLFEKGGKKARVLLSTLNVY